MFLDKNLVLSNFPFTFRGNQEQTVHRIADALNREEIQYVVLQAPVGAGKSPMGMSAAKTSENTFVLTSNKFLQDQYMRDFSNDLSDLRGRANYQCRMHPGYNCAGSPCRESQGSRGKCAKEKACEYHDALFSATEAQVTSLNFAAGITFLNYTPYFPPRKLLIIDEAHLLQDNLTNFIEFSVTASHLEKMLPVGSGDTANIPFFETTKEYQAWLEIIQSLMSKQEENFTSPIRVDALTGSMIKLEDIENFNRKITTILGEISSDASNLVVEHRFFDLGQKSVEKISFKPIDVSRYAHNNLFKFGEKTLMMSATIINYEEFVKSMGLPPEKCVFIDVPSTFPKENRPIFKDYVGQLNKNNMQTMMPLIIEKIKKIMRDHSEEKGIIHTHTYDTAKKIFFEIEKDPAFRGRLLFPDSSSKQSDILAFHAASKKSTVLLSPSMTEGVDLKGDLSRFQVIVKVPYPSLGDKVVKARMDKNPNWYTFRTLLTMIQAYGRSVRSETDYAVTYVLDGAFDGLVSRCKKSLPSWFTEAIM